MNIPDEAMHKKFKDESDIPAEIYSAFYEEVAADPERALIYVANWAYAQACEDEMLRALVGGRE